MVDGNGFPGREERLVMETESDGEDSSSTMILAEERTRRKDPSNYFKYYDRGWNITDDHYFAVSLLACILKKFIYLFRFLDTYN